MKLKIAWLYYDLLELYGDRGNIKSIEKVLSDNKIEFEVDKISLGDVLDISNHDIIFLGGGSDRAQNMLYKDLIDRADQIKKAMANNCFILSICGGYQMFGKYYIDANQNEIKGLEIFDFYSTTGTSRCIGNVVCEVILGDKVVKIVGFENHGGQTKDVKYPFAKVVVGNGNEHNGQYEGFMKDNFIGTYIHGALLPKNPEITKFIIESVLKKKYQDMRVINIDKIQYAMAAKNVLLERI